MSDTTTTRSELNAVVGVHIRLAVFLLTLMVASWIFDLSWTLIFALYCLSLGTGLYLVYRRASKTPEASADSAFSGPTGLV